MRRIVEWQRRSFAAAASILLLAATAHATIRAPLDAQLVGAAKAARDGEKLSGEIRLHAFAAVEVSGLSLVGAGWSELALEAPSSAKLGAGEEIVLRFTGRPADAKQPLRLTFRTPMGRESRGFDLSGEPERLSRPALTTILEVDRSAPGPMAAASLRRPDAAITANAFEHEPRAEDLGGTPTLASPVTVHGRFAYVRSGVLTVGADGVTVRVYQVVSGPDPVIGSGVTDAFGYYSISASSVSGPGTPDYYVTFTASNSAVRVLQGNGDPYGWGTAVYWDVGGADLDLGTQGPTDASTFPAVHQLATITRAWRWIVVNNSEFVPQVALRWPIVSSVPFFSAGSIFMNASRQWNEDDMVHEYGHHWQWIHGVDLGFEYCNNVCDDDPPDDCGHCTWCPESEHIAWNEGWSDWLSDVVTRDFQGLYGLAPLSLGNYEFTQNCGSGTTDPLRTEGHFAALLRDLEDSTNEDNWTGDPFRDQLDVDPSWIFTCARYDDVQGPTDFLLKFHARYPIFNEAYWETAINNGYDLDTQFPSAVTNLHSTSHTVGATSTDPTIDLAWTRATDDWSGPGQYTIYVGVSLSDISYIETVGDVTSWTSMSLPPGTWRFWVYTTDRHGFFNPNPAALGPFTVQQATPANLVWFTPLGWQRPAVPRPSPDATTGAVPNPASLIGNSASTWANLAGRNSGTQSTGTGFVDRAQVDGVYGGTGFVSGSLAGGTTVMGVNGGPITVRGGRHTFAVRMDDLDAIAESSESDNVWAHPGVWSPLTVGPNAVNTRATPPNKTGGWSGVLDGSPLYYDSDGLRMSTLNGFWSVFWVAAADRHDDYDLRLHFPTSSPDTGFAGWQAASAQVEGLLDAVIVNRNVVTSPTNWDVGVINWRGTSNYTAGQAASTTMAVGDSFPLTMPANGYVIVREFYVPPGAPVLHRVRVDHDPATGPLTMLVMRPDFTVGSILDYDEYGETDATTGTGVIDFYPSAGWHGVVLYRDPRTNTGQALPFVLEVEKTPPNPAAYRESGWYGPVVPRPDADATYNNTPEPAELFGDGDTWGNWTFKENGPVPLNDMIRAEMRADGVSLAAWNITGWAPFGTMHLNDVGPYPISGGRHTFTAHVDTQDLLEETDETDNFGGEQWIWTPVTVVPEVPVTRGTPPDVTGGWADVSNAGSGLRYNCDGVRTAPFAEGPGHDGRWGAAAILPVGGDADLRLHEVATSVHDGFDALLAWSGWIRDLTDYAVVNFNRTPFRPFDVGIQRASGNPSVTVEIARSRDLGAPIDHWYGPFTLGAGRLMQLYEVRLDPGLWAVDLYPESGTADVGLSLHAPGPEFQSKSTPQDSALSFFNPFWSVETTLVSVPATDAYAIAVWKVGSADLPLSNTYRLHVRRVNTTTAAEEAPPTETAISFVAPNPAVQGSRIGFDLARSSEVTLELLDVRGARVRTLAEGPWPAGRHEQRWDGRDGAGHVMPPGMYFLRLAAAGVTRVTKVVVAH